MEFYEQKTTTFQNQNGRVRSAFKVVKAKDGVIKSMEGVSNRNNASLYHILQTIRKNNMEMRSRYSIHMDDLKKLLMEGDRMADYKKIENTPIVRKKVVKKPTAKAVPTKVATKKSSPTKKKSGVTKTKSAATKKKSTKKSAKISSMKKSTK